MGLYDTFTPKNCVCPNCENKIIDFQSKDFDSMMENFVEGKSTFRRYYNNSKFLNSGIYEGLGQCNKCHKFYTAKIEIKDRIFKRVFDIKESLN